MPLTSFDIFEGGLAIGSFSNHKDVLQWYINIYEPEFMNHYIGSGNYQNLLEDINSASPDVKGKAEKLWNTCKLPCAIYIWCYYTNENQEKQSGSGNVKMKNTNSTVSDSSGKIARNWNWMVELTTGNRIVLLSDFNIKSGIFHYNNIWI